MKKTLNNACHISICGSRASEMVKMEEEEGDLQLSAAESCSGAADGNGGCAGVGTFGVVAIVVAIVCPALVCRNIGDLGGEQRE